MAVVVLDAKITAPLIQLQALGFQSKKAKHCNMREEGELTEACHLGEEEITNQVNQAVSLSNGGSQQ